MCTNTTLRWMPPRGDPVASARTSGNGAISANAFKKEVAMMRVPERDVAVDDQCRSRRDGEKRECVPLLGTRLRACVQTTCRIDGRGSRRYVRAAAAGARADFGSYVSRRRKSGVPSMASGRTYLALEVLPARTASTRCVWEAAVRESGPTRTGGRGGSTEGGKFHTMYVDTSPRSRMPVLPSRGGARTERAPPTPEFNPAEQKKTCA